MISTAPQRSPIRALISCIGPYAVALSRCMLIVLRNCGALTMNPACGFAGFRSLLLMITLCRMLVYSFRLGVHILVNRSSTVVLFVISSAAFLRGAWILSIMS